MSNDAIATSQDLVPGGKVVRFEPRLAVEAVLGVSLNNADGTVVVAFRGTRNPRVEVALPLELAEVVIAAFDRVLSQARSAPPSP